MLVVGTPSWAGMHRRWSAAVATLGAALLSSCAGSDAGPAASMPDVSVPATAAESAAAASTNPPETSQPDTSPPTTAPASPASTGGQFGAPMTVTYEDLVARSAEMVGVPVVVRVRAFFLEQCPPPGGSVTRCSLSLFVTEPSRHTLIYADRATALPVFDSNGRVTCFVGDGITTACTNWQHSAVYDVTGELARAPGEPGLELHIVEFTRTED